MSKSFFRDCQKSFFNWIITHTSEIAPEIAPAHPPGSNPEEFKIFHLYLWWFELSSAGDYFLNWKNLIIVVWKMEHHKDS